jgi:hypothetical protein
LQPAGLVDQTVLNTAAYFVTVRLGTLNPMLVAEYPPPRTVIWEETSEEASPLLERLDSDTKEQLFRGREPRIKRPTIAGEDARPRTVAERRRLPEHPLVRMRVLLPKNP